MYKNCINIMHITQISHFIYTDQFDGQTRKGDECTPHVIKGARRQVQGGGLALFRILLFKNIYDAITWQQEKNQYDL